ncbi:Cyclohexanone monooxygenase [Actinomycetales bacterium JB111]|nr:Cyclohexanone monooxygenase [Actinomycetales bacterium JB111]
MTSPSAHAPGPAPDDEDGTTTDLDAVVVGAGFSGVYALHSLRGIGLDVRVVESGGDVGGTWYHNRYPGARCDIESLDYSYSFDHDIQQEWTWTERYASQPEILAYIRHVADRLDLRRHVDLHVRVTSATWDEASGRWSVGTDAGRSYTAQHLVLATGVLSAAQSPQIPGLESFEGTLVHTADWPDGTPDAANAADREAINGKRVGVIGTGSSATQLIPLVAERAARLTVFQRTPNFVMPAQNHPLGESVVDEWKAHYPERRAFARRSRNGHNQASNPLRGRDLTTAERHAELESRWSSGGLYMMRAFADILTDPYVNAEAADFVREKIRNIVDDPRTAADLLPPRDLAIGTKRLCSGTNYYETYNRDDVRLVNLRRTPIDRIEAGGVRTRRSGVGEGAPAAQAAAGDEPGGLHELDTLVLATGFDAMTGSYVRIDVTGRDGLTLREKWRDGPRTHLGVMSAGFPNLFLMAGPQTPSVFSNMVTQAEIHVEWVTRAIRDLREAGLGTIEASVDAEDAWVDHVTAEAEQTLYATSRNSWFWGANTPGKAQVFTPYIGGIARYLEAITTAADQDYAGFARTQPTPTLA